MFRSLVVIGCLSAAASAYAVGLAVTPIQLGLTGAPGATVTGVIRVSSSRAQENNIQVLFGDYTIDAQGKRKELTSGAGNGRSCRAWLDADQHQFVTPQQGSVPVVITATIPTDASGSYWAEAFFESMPAPVSFSPGVARAPVVGVSVIPRIGIPIIVTVKGTEHYAVKAGAIAATKTDAGIEATIQLENTGNAVVVVAGAVALETPAEGAPEELGSKDIDPVTSYPGASCIVKVTIPIRTLDPATILHAYFRYGPGPEQRIETSSNLQALLSHERDHEQASRH